MLERRPRAGVGVWVVAGLIAAAVAAVYSVLFYLADARWGDAQPLKGCLEWCRSHGDHATPELYLDCAWRCELAIKQRRGPGR